METTRGPLAVVAAGVTLTVVSGMATLAAGLEASAGAGPGQFAVVGHDGMAPGGRPALVLLLGLLLIGVGAALHDGRRLRATAPRATTPSTVTGQRNAPSGPAQPVYVITTLPERVAAPPRRRTTSGARLELV